MANDTHRIVKIDQFTMVLATVAIAGSVMVLLRTATYGIFLTDDADLYISTARSLLNGDGFTIWTRQPYADSAPLYPLLLAVFSFLGWSVITTAEYLNALALGLTVFVIAVWLKSRIRSRFLVFWAACVCALTPVLAEPSAIAGTEILFILFVCCSLFALDRFLITSRRSFLILSAVWAACALLTRYVGVTLIGSGLLLLFFNSTRPLRIRLMDAAKWLVVSTALFGVWILRNVVNIDSVLGRMNPDRFSVLGSLDTATREIFVWVFRTELKFLDDQIYNNVAGADALLAVALKIVLFACLVVGIGVAFLRYRPELYRRNRGFLAICVGFISVYSLFLIVLLPLTNVELSTRYLVPLFPFLVVMVTIALDCLISSPKAYLMEGQAALDPVRKKWISSLVTLLACLWLLSWISTTYRSLRLANETGIGYNSSEWAESEIVSYLNSNQPRGTVWSNDHAALYVLADYPGKNIYRTPLDLAEAKSQIYEQRAAGYTNYIVWFWTRVYHRLPDYSLEELGSSLGMEVVAVLRDGVILRDSAESPANPIVWEEDFYFTALLADTRHIIGSYFDVYVDDSYNRLLYVRDLCSYTDLEQKFLLDVYPLDSSDLLDPQVPFNKLDFSFDPFPIGGRCLTTRSLPKYGISLIRTGQQDRDGILVWEGEYSFVE